MPIFILIKFLLLIKKYRETSSPELLCLKKNPSPPDLYQHLASKRREELCLLRPLILSHSWTLTNLLFLFFIFFSPSLWVLLSTGVGSWMPELPSSTLHWHTCAIQLESLSLDLPKPIRPPHLCRHISLTPLLRCPTCHPILVHFWPPLPLESNPLIS